MRSRLPFVAELAGPVAYGGLRYDGQPGEEDHEEYARDQLGFIPLIVAAATSLYGKYQEHRQEAKAEKEAKKGIAAQLAKKKKAKDAADAAGAAGAPAQASMFGGGGLNTKTVLIAAVLIGGGLYFASKRK